MERIPEPELMDDPAQALAYAASDFSRSDRAMVADLLDRSGAELGSEILDLGCGPGNITFLLAEALAARDPAATVLVARSIDAGWATTLGLVAAAVVETGGDLSHGSILVRELGLPAVTNVRGVRRAVAEGDTLEVRADAGVVQRLDPPPGHGGTGPVAPGR